MNTGLIRAPFPPQDLNPAHWQMANKEQQVPGRIQGGERVMFNKIGVRTRLFGLPSLKPHRISA